MRPSLVALVLALAAPAAGLAQTPPCGGDAAPCPVSATDTAIVPNVAVPSLAALKALKTRPSVVAMAGFAAPHDGGGGTFTWVAGDTTVADDALVVQPAAGPAGRYKRLFRGAVDPQWYGARCNGTTDDAAAFAKALASGRDVAFPDKTCAIGSQIKVSGVALTGAGSGSVLKALDASFDMLAIAGTGSRVRNLSFVGAATNGSTTQSAIRTDATSVPADFEITGNRFGSGAGAPSLNNGIYLLGHGERGFRIHGNHFENLIGTVSGTGYGVLTGAVSHGTISANTFHGTRGSAGRHAVYLSAGASQVVVSGNIADNFNSEAYTLNQTAGQPVNDTISIVDNIARNCGGDGGDQSSISVFGAARNIVIKGNQITASQGNGIYVFANGLASTDVMIAHNRITDPNYAGIIVRGTRHQHVANNVVSGASRKAPQTYVDIDLGSDGTTAPQQILVHGNQGIGVAGVSRAPFTFDTTAPLPIFARVYGNDFSPTNYFTGPTYNAAAMKVLIDGRLQFKRSWVPPPVAHGAAYSFGGLSIPGAEAGDVVSVGYTGNIDGMILIGQVTGADTAEVILVNLSGGTKTAGAGTLRLDVFKRDGQGQ